MSRLRSRVLHHGILALGSAGLVGGMFALVSSPDIVFRLSMATAYTGLALLGGTLLLGPLNLWRKRTNPVSTDLRRDLGIWAGIVGLLHVLIGLQVHFRGRMWLYFLPEAGFGPRHDPFGLANYAGLGAALILAVLLALSNDLSLRRLGAKRWKALQRWNYGLLLLVVFHGVVYQILENREPPYVLLGALMVAGVVVLQGCGVWWKRQQAL
ncbi:ferric reductase-like transmembrane domain-containing protein [Anthocerotibacter panamensis]|uniref:ferric reductase-like transmembrane domain-containing protein n=1 Tax=Anthocerotibacter panamensis TaxID=2857077 RepID=UPI001C402788|nr:ferric reductase-like transmembrane domain-containing protein [Anthocerotibacter panamensis]